MIYFIHNNSLMLLQLCKFQNNRFILLQDFNIQSQNDKSISHLSFSELDHKNNLTLHFLNMLKYMFLQHD
ncbi:unnamed protein product [Paramecium sonneborni]|uniref:Uncharacterized protein n=1 Tax=Paramecium sonneborni TaxID=65129 RepID=A0A8S1QPB9_9CILI|nr:unnamed protein product [Paramecium sonneborni]